MTKIRAHGERPVGGSTGSGLPRPTKRDAAKPGVCMTCHEEYDVDFVAGLPKFYDHGTRNPHRCKP